MRQARLSRQENHGGSEPPIRLWSQKDFLRDFAAVEIYRHDMIMWIAALVLVAATAGIGFRQGGIRAAFTFIGLVIAAVVAISFAPV